MTPPERDRPVVQARLVGKQYIITCPYCNQHHHHGATPGHRVPHCTNLTDAAHAGYIIAHPAPSTP